MSDLKELQDEAVAPLTSMLTQPKSLNVVHMGGVEKVRNTPFHNVHQNAEIINHRDGGKLMVP
jgi:hypothetical protein